MRYSLIKRTITSFFFALFAIYCLNGSRVVAFRSGPEPARTGAPGELTCNMAGCHNSFATNSGGGALSLTGLPATYTPNQEINLTVTLNQANRALYGFELTALDEQNRRAGELIVTDASRTQRITGVVGGNLREYIQHNFNGTSPNGANQGSWNFRWKAPAQSVGRVTFYIAGNAANNDGTSFGDFIYTISQSIQPGAALGQFASLSAASFAQPPSLAPNGIAAGFGSGLATNVVSASTVPLPTQLDGTEVKVRDAAGTDRDAGLFFVAPTQINYLIPEGTANGTATITVRRSGNDVAQGTLTIESVAPGLFSANANGQGVAAAVILRRRGGVDTFEPVAQLNSTSGRFEPIPINLGPETDTVVLVAFGTGFRAAAQSAVSATIGGTASTFVATAPAPGFVGLDQANILIPRSLAGRGLVDVVFRADNKAANTVQINVQ
jgi:uncharacterized protein (TIGR03437 family)